MGSTYSRPSVRRLGISVIAIVAALCVLLAVTTSALASTVHVYDNANVLNRSQVQNAAASLPYPMDIYTVNNFNGTKAAFQQQTASHTAGNSNLIVMAIDTVNRFVFVSSGSRVPLLSSQATDAANSFASNFSNGGYTNATLAAINSLQNSLRSSSGSNSRSPNTPAPAAGPFGGLGFGTLCCIGLLVLAALALFGFFRRRRTGGGLFGGRAAVPPYNQPYNQGYPPTYGPGYNQGGGIGPLGAGGLGAAAGGFLGYELGKQAGEREARGDQSQGNNFGDGGAFGGSGGADFGGSGGADFGGGGGGGDFGGGSGGGGGDFGGGGGGSGGSNF